MEVPSFLRSNISGMSIGKDSLSPGTNDYEAPFPFPGTIHRVEVTFQPFQSPSDEKKDARDRYRTEMARQ